MRVMKKILLGVLIACAMVSPVWADPNCKCNCNCNCNPNGWRAPQFSPAPPANRHKSLFDSTDFAVPLADFDNTPTTRNADKMWNYALLWSDHALRNHKIAREDSLSNQERKAKVLYDFLINRSYLDTDRLSQSSNGLLYWEATFKDLYSNRAIDDPYTLLCRVTNAWGDDKIPALTPYEFAVIYKMLCDSQDVPARILAGYESHIVYEDHNGSKWTNAYGKINGRYRKIVSANAPLYLIEVTYQTKSGNKKTDIAHPRLSMLAKKEGKKYDFALPVWRDPHKESLEYSREFPIWELYLPNSGK